VFALAEGAVGDALQEAGVVFEDSLASASASGAFEVTNDIGPVHLVGVGVEMVVAERLQAGEHRVDLRFPADEGGQCGFPVAPGLLGAEFVVGVVIGFGRVMWWLLGFALSLRCLSAVVSCIVVLGWMFALSARLINSIST
jgi:hypothetical protein